MSELQSKVVVEENGHFQFDCIAAEMVVELHSVMKRLPLSDVDFIAQMNQEILFVEYKNANVPGAAEPHAMLGKIRHGDFYTKIAKKFYDSLLLYWTLHGQDPERPIKYILLIEAPLIDKKMRRQLTLKIGKQLPFEIEGKTTGNSMITAFEVVDLDEWKEKVPDIVVEEVEQE